MTRWAVMLRGVNLGNRQLKSTELKAAIETLGYRDVKTLLASGNAVFDADEDDAKAVEQAVHTALKAHTGLDSDIFARDGDQLSAAIAANPFAQEVVDRPSFVVVMFHHDPFDAALIDALAARYDGPERMVAVGRELFIDFPDGQGRSNLIPMMLKAGFPKRYTGRNWNTVTKLAAAVSA